MSYSFFNSGSSVGFFTGSVGIQTGGWFSSSNPDLIASGSASGYYVGNIYADILRIRLGPHRA